MDRSVATMRAAVRKAEQGDSAGAIAGLTRAAAMAPKDPRLQVQCGNLLRQLQRPADALICFDRAAVALPDNPAVLGNRGIALAELGRHQEAFACIDQVARLRPDDPNTLVNRGSMLVQLGRLTEALADYDRAIALRPDRAPIRINRANLLMDLRRPADALADYDRAMTLRPNHHPTIADRGNALLALDRPEAALAAYDAALRLDPNSAHTLDHRGKALQVLGRLDDAIASYDTAVRIAPNVPGFRVHRGLCRLLLGDFRNGWPDYEFRRPPPHLPWPESVAGKTVLLQTEQGLGDAIMFCRYGPLVKALGATVLLQVPPPLVRLMATLPGVDLVVSSDAPKHDHASPLMSLPLTFGTKIKQPPYLSADPALVTQWSSRLPASGRRRVGLVWCGNVDHPNDRNRSIPLARFARLVDGEADFVGLQTEVREADEPALRDILMPDPDNRDFADTAALVALMDLVVTVDTSVAHLAGAMGKPVWILLPHDPDWRWMLGRDDSPWYPSARLFRQPAPGDWDKVLDRVIDELSRTAKDR
jgi:tetratricopeptide (TPR) repeat protein